MPGPPPYASSSTLRWRRRRTSRSPYGDLEEPGLEGLAEQALGQRRAEVVREDGEDLDAHAAVTGPKDPRAGRSRSAGPRGRPRPRCLHERNQDARFLRRRVDGRAAGPPPSSPGPPRVPRGRPDGSSHLQPSTSWLVVEALGRGNAASSSDAEVAPGEGSRRVHGPRCPRSEDSSRSPCGRTSASDEEALSSVPACQRSAGPARSAPGKLVDGLDGNFPLAGRGAGGRCRREAREATLCLVADADGDTRCRARPPRRPRRRAGRGSCGLRGRSGGPGRLRARRCRRRPSSLRALDDAGFVGVVRQAADDRLDQAAHRGP